MALLWAARRGLSEAELLDLLGADGSPLPRAHWSPLFLAAEHALVSRGGLLGFFHDHLRQAVQHRYVPAEAQQRAAHQALADYFRAHRDSRRAIDELPWQLSRAGAWAKLWILLGNADFLARAWAASEWDVKALWGELGANSPDLRMIGAYQPIVEQPHKFDAGVQRAAMLLLAHSGHRDGALAIGRSLIAQGRRDGDLRLTAEAIGEVGQLLGDPAARERAFHEQEELARSLGDPALEASALILQVGLLIEGGRLDEAEGLLDRQEELARRAESRAQLHLGLGNRAVIHAMRGDVDGAEQLLGDKERIAREIGDLAGVASALHNRGIVRANRGQAAGAIELFEESARINRSLGDRETLLGTVLARGQLLLQVKRVPEAKTVLREAIGLAEELSAPAQAERARQLLGQAEQYVDLSETVDEGARKWLREHRPQTQPASEQLSRLQTTRDELRKALERDPRDAATLTELGAVCLELGEPQSSIGHSTIGRTSPSLSSYSNWISFVLHWIIMHAFQKASTCRPPFTWNAPGLMTLMYSPFSSSTTTTTRRFSFVSGSTNLFVGKDAVDDVEVDLAAEGRAVVTRREPAAQLDAGRQERLLVADGQLDVARRA
jgi:tetratricopeptide (TPR) repeat protein